MLSIGDQVIYKPEGIDGPQIPATVIDTRGVDMACITINETGETVNYVTYFTNELNMPPRAPHIALS